MIAADRIAIGPAVAISSDPFTAFVQTRREQAVRVAYRLVGGDRAAAEDIAQNAFLRAHRALPRFRGTSTLDTWFYRILVREAHRYRRRRLLRQLFGSEPAEKFEPIDPRPEGDPLLRRRITEAMSKLSPAQREAFVLVHLEDISLAECASILGKAVGTVKSHLHRALETLRHELADVALEGADRERGRAS